MVRALPMVALGAILLSGPGVQAAWSAPADGDAFRSPGVPWDPDNDDFSRKVFESFDSISVRPHFRPDFERLRPSDRPAGFAGFLLAWFIAMPLAVTAFLGGRVLFRRRPKGPRRALALPDDASWLAMALTVGFGARLVAAWLLPLHGSEWGSVEHKTFSQIPDILFNGYEVLTNPPLLNLVEHFVFRICPVPLCFRIPTVIAGVFLVYASRCAARELFGRRAGIVAAFLVAINAGLVIWSATMRAYLPMAAFILAAFPAAARLSRGSDDDRDAAALALFGALAVWTHYIAWLWLGLIGLWLAASLVRTPRKLLRPILAALFVAVSFLPLYPFFFASFSDKQGSMLPPGWFGHMLALATGMPWLSGAILAVAVVASRPWKNRGILVLLAVCAGYFLLCLATSGIIFWEVPYSVGLSAAVMVLMAGILEKIRFRNAWLTIVLTGLASTWVFVCMEPSDDSRVAAVTRPFLWRSVSAGLFSDSIRRSAAVGTGAETVLVTPAFESESFLYHLGPVTTEQAGVEPVIVRNFDEMRFLSDGVEYRVVGFERYWSWHLGQWPELERFSSRFRTFWYARMQSNCQRSEGMTWSRWDCAWLARNCKLVESTASDELYLCGHRAGTAVSVLTP